MRRDKKISCTSCHDPHASDSPRLWRLNVGSGFELCRKCHTD
jgi:predicted CXXCH cytochrome family protein